MATEKTVKAREHHGARSLDLTLPADVRERFDVEPGDIFTVEVEESDGQLAVTYTRVYPD